MFPNGAYHNSRPIHDDFFTRETKNIQDAKLVEEDMPFLYKLVSSKLLHGIKSNEKPDKNHDCNDSNLISEDGKAGDSFDAPNSSTIELGKDHLHQEALNQREKRAKMTAKTVCAMVAFGKNRRANLMQLWNLVVFLACGVTN
ncbi:hypothetical protein PCANC_13656 [Puccinia coronata f. sp. avenae]|uniref:Uncharacterized protein n=1 Tax=Puccinia coronata f. sp. avenae TaxID=200324 RepID=A0A2N5UKW3_9BASI|nr:hypothetical protein PCANC_13656 [Puccinia coronata f. sp. avenae]PLW47904.1 hypothetical protein PCASD_04960 [Puccinia coronata f. sp. avenae]